MLRLISSTRIGLATPGKTELASTATAPPPPSGKPDTFTLVDLQSSYAGNSTQHWVAARPIVQRSYGKTTGNVPVYFTYTGQAPATVEAQVIVASDGSIVTSWTPISGLVIDDASHGHGLLLNVPQGGDYLLQARTTLSDSTSPTSAGTQRWGIGPVFYLGGQSNMGTTIFGNVDSTGATDYTEASAAVKDATTYNGAVFDSAGWHIPSNGTTGPTGSGFGVSGSTWTNNIAIFIRLISAALKQKYGVAVPVGITALSANAASITGFTSNANGGDNILINTGTALNTMGYRSPGYIYAGDLEGMLWHQGEADSGNATNANAYEAELHQLYQMFQDYVAPFGRTSFLFGTALLGGLPPAGEAYIETTRLAQQGLPVWGQANGHPGAQIGWGTFDLGDGELHFAWSGDPLAGRRSMRRLIQTVFYWLGCSGTGPSGQSFSGRGPHIDPTPARSGQTVTLSVVHEGGTSLLVGNGPTGKAAVAGTLPTGFYCNQAADFSGAYVIPTVALVNNNTQIQLTFPPGTFTGTNTIYIKYLGGKIGNTTADASGYVDSSHPDTSGALYDNVTYPLSIGGTASADQEVLGLPLQPTNGAIAVS